MQYYISQNVFNYTWTAIHYSLYCYEYDLTIPIRTFIDIWENNTVITKIENQILN